MSLFIVGHGVNIADLGQSAEPQIVQMYSCAFNF